MLKDIGLRLLIVILYIAFLAGVMGFVSLIAFLAEKVVDSHSLGDIVSNGFIVMLTVGALYWVFIDPFVQKKKKKD